METQEILVPAGLTTDGLLGRRYLARFIDSFVNLLVVAILLVLLSVAAGDLTTLIYLLIVPPIWIAYGSLLESSPWQATIGKRALGLKVYDAGGGRLGLPQAIGRNLVKDGPFLILNFIPGGNVIVFVWLAAHVIAVHNSPVSQAIHDGVAGTWVAAPSETTLLNLR